MNGIRIQDRWNVSHGDLIQFADVIFRASRESGDSNAQTVVEDSADRALALIQFEHLITTRSVVPFFQPLVRIDTRAVTAYEVLGRSRLFGLSEPRPMFAAAAVLGAEAELSRLFRSQGVRFGQNLPQPAKLFLNTRPVELAEPDLLELSLRELHDAHPAAALVLEVHEAAVTQPRQMQELRAMLDTLKIGLAYDDFGAGQARLIELSEVPPDYLKFDISLIQGIHEGPAQRQKMLENLVRMAQELGITVVAEGVEQEGEHEVCRQVGFDLGQGYLYGRPAPRRQYQGGAES